MRELLKMMNETKHCQFCGALLDDTWIETTKDGKCPQCGAVDPEFEKFIEDIRQEEREELNRKISEREHEDLDLINGINQVVKERNDELEVMRVVYSDIHDVEKSIVVKKHRFKKNVE